MRAKWLCADPEQATYWLKCPRCGERFQVSALAVPPPAYDIGVAKPIVPCRHPWCGEQLHVPGPRDRAKDEGLSDPGVREHPLQAIQALAFAAERGKNG